MSKMDITEILECKSGTVGSTASSAMLDAKKEIERLRDIIARAKAESDLIEHKGKQMIAVPYWFIHAK